MIFKKQFIFTKRELPHNANWNNVKISGYLLYTHFELDVNEVENENFHIIFVGDAFDYIETEYSNSQILSSVIKSINSFTDLLRAFDRYCGSFIVFCYNKSNNELNIFTDTASLREVYFLSVSKTEIIAASQPITINSIIPLKPDNSKLAKEFYGSKAFDKKRTYIGDQTDYLGVKHLKPNFYLNVNNCIVKRFFPYEVLQESDLETAALKAAKIIQGYFMAAGNRYKLAIPVTAGWESRVFLAASKNQSHKVFYYVFKHKGYTEEHPDIKTPQKLLNKLGLTFNKLEYPIGIEKETLSIIDKSFSYPRYSNFNFIVNVIGEKIPDHLIANGNVSEVARMQWDDIKIPNEKVIAYLQSYPNQQYALDYYSKWLNENKKIFDKFNYKVSDMLYWEENCGNWVAKTNTEFRYKTEIFQPFSSRELLTTLLSVNKRYRRKQDAVLYKKIIKHLWPECLSEPMNPGGKKQIIRLMQKVGVYGIYRNALLRAHLFIIKNKHR